MKTAISEATPHGAVARGRLLLARVSEGVWNRATGAVRGTLFTFPHERTCAEKVRVLSDDKSDICFYLQIRTDEAPGLKISHMPRSFQRISQIKCNVAPRVEAASLFPEMNEPFSATSKPSD